MPVLPIDRNKFDRNYYKLITLENKMKVLLISTVEPEIDTSFSTLSSSSNSDSLQESNENNLNKPKAKQYKDKVDEDKTTSEDDSKNDIANSDGAAALLVNVGLLESPPDLLGLPHFLEHMVFMGSKKYPGENIFSETVSEFGGTSNAETGYDSTLYHFHCLNDGFLKLLDIFANLFIDPLFKKKSMDREVEAIESEFQIGYMSNLYRLRDLLVLSAKEGNPFGRFDAGNVKSLRDIPKMKKIDLYSRMKEFYKQKYSSHKMTLVVSSIYPMEYLEDEVIKIFSKIPLNETEDFDYAQYSMPLDTPSFNRYYQYVPIKKKNILYLTWEFPELISKYKSKPNKILEHLFNNEGENSLKQYLVKQNLIKKMSGNVEVYETRLNAIFTVSFSLTETGFNNIQMVIERVFSFINFIKTGIPQHVIDDLINIYDIIFKNISMDDNHELVEKLAQNLQYFNPSHINSGDILIFEYDKELTRSLIDMMTVDRVNIAVSSKDFETYTDNQTEWYGVKYNVRDITPEERQIWSNPKRIKFFQFPQPNRLTPKNLDLIPLPKLKRSKPTEISRDRFPKLKKFGKLWFNRDYIFLLPKVHATFYLKDECLRSTIRDRLLFDIWMQVMGEEISSLEYESESLDMKFSFNDYPNAIKLQLNAYTECFQRFLTLLLRKLRKFSLTKEGFERHIKDMTEIYKNELLNVNDLINDILDKILFPCTFLTIEKLNNIGNITLEDVEEFSKSVFKNLAVNALCFGNLTEDMASDAFTNVVNSLGITGTGELKVDQMRCMKKEVTHVRIVNLNPLDKSIYIHVEYFIGPATLKNLVLNTLLESALNEKCFDYLRTKETLGYDVSFTSTCESNILSISVKVRSESNKFTLKHCLTKIEYFLNTKAPEILKKLDKTNFHNYLDIFESETMDLPSTMEDDAEFWLTPIYKQDYVFNIHLKLSKIANRLTVADLRNFYKDNYQNKNIRQKIIVEVDTYRKSKDSQSESTETSLNIEYAPLDSKSASDTLEDIISNCPLYPEIILKI